MAYHAACRACESAGIAPADVDIIIVATVTGETHFPATACWLQGKLGNSKAIPLDINMGCAGFMYALSIARALLIDRGANYALVIGADRVTGIADYTDPLPQALVLTAIVIGFATTALFLVLLLASRGLTGSDHVDGQER